MTAKVVVGGDAEVASMMCRVSEMSVSSRAVVVATPSVFTCTSRLDPRGTRLVNHRFPRLPGLLQLFPLFLPGMLCVSS